MNAKVVRPLKVVFFHIMRENFSGAQKNIYRLLINLDKEEVCPVLIGQAQSPLTELTSREGIETRIIPFPPELEVFDGKILKVNIVRSVRFIKGIWMYNKKLLREFKEIRPEVVWCDNIRTLITSYIACKFIGAKVIWNIWSEPEGKIAWIVHRIGLLLADVINLEYARQGEKIFGRVGKRKMFKEKMVPLYTGVSDFEEMLGTDIRKELSLRSDQVLVVMASSILAGKGQWDLIKSVEAARVKHQNVHLVLAGTAVDSSPQSIQYYEQVYDYVIDKDLNGYIHFIGWRSDIRDIFEGSDIYVSTSYTESFPDAVREAMLASLPVVVTDVGGTRELVDVGKNGYLFNPGDIQTLTDHISLLVENPSLRKTMGLESKQIIDSKFSTERYARDFEKMLEQLVSQ